MAQKLPPPPPVALNDPVLNRWFIELTSILSAGGDIDPNSIAGLTTAYAQIATNTTNISNLQGTTGGQAGDIAVLQGQVAALTTSLATLSGTVTSLAARNQILNGAGAPGAGLGNNGDLFINNIGGAGTRLYGKIGGAWVAIA